MVYQAGFVQGLEADCVVGLFSGAVPFSSVYRPFTT